MASVRPPTDLTVADLWKEVKDPATLWGDVSRETLRAVKLLLQNRVHADSRRSGESRFPIFRSG